ncbi:MAG: hypothetical protein PHW79_08435 [Candidatus Marinimicrobia bacterium]|jgi:regulation of enolase protein 1 (concanavalin A-like superfamily)|nr:hypothetical protein [Candidatus Neomarinimicrobiota bacterium]
MREIVLSIPDVDVEQNIEIEVKINGKKKTLNYRVELVSWEKDLISPTDQVNTLRHIIKEHEKDWELIQIGVPEIDRIPIMFRKRVLREMAT